MTEDRVVVEERLQVRNDGGVGDELFLRPKELPSLRPISDGTTISACTPRQYLPLDDICNSQELKCVLRMLSMSKKSL